jgi:large subunit ribosomal protein L21
MFAVIKTGGKQYVVAPDQKLKIEKVEGSEDGVVIFDNVLLVSSGASATTVGEPLIVGATVEGKILRQARDRKKVVFKYHSKARYRKLKGHRQQFTEVQITKINKK